MLTIWWTKLVDKTNQTNDKTDYYNTICQKHAKNGAIYKTFQ